MSEFIKISRDDAILQLHFARPQKKNAITGAMYLAMVDAMVDAEARDDLRVILFTAEGTTFSAGNDLMDFIQAASSLEEPAAAKFIRAIAKCTKPIVAAVNGPAVGVGMTMLLHCDLVYATASASLSTPFINLALVPEGGSSLLMPQRVGYQRSAQMLLLGETMSAHEAVTAGLYNAIVADEDLQAFARGKALALAAKPPRALAISRDLMRRGRETLESHMNEEFMAFGAALQSPEAKEAFTAFFEKRPPNFSKLT